MAAVLAGHDLLAVMPTGHGKSAIYQMAALALGGLTVVVTPLIALQWDQVQHLVDSGADLTAVAINSSRTEHENAASWESLTTAATAVVFLAPEQLVKPEVRERLTARGVTQFVVDEAHCVSAWGHDFRPDYLRLGEIIDDLGHPVTVAMTATGSAPVREDIVAKLRLRDAEIQVSGFERPNLHLEVVRHQHESEKRQAVLDRVAGLEAPGLVYVATRRDAEELAEELSEAGAHRIRAFHGTMPAKQKKAVYDEFHAGEVDVVVATSAFGMGIDKADIRFVVHESIPESVDAYYQEIGRAGRDGEPARAVLFYRQEDLGLRSFFATSSPHPAKLAAIGEELKKAESPLEIAELAESTGVSARSATQQLNLLIEAGAVEEAGGSFALTPEARDRKVFELVSLAQEAQEQRDRIEHSRIDMMRLFAETNECRRRFILGYFGAQSDHNCGLCDTCESGAADEYSAALARGASGASDGNADADAAAAGTGGGAGTSGTGAEEFAVDEKVEHEQFGPGTVVSVEDDRITVFFEKEGYTVLSKELIAEKRLLTAQ